MLMPESDQMPDKCYVFIHASLGARIGLVRKGMPGWLVTSIDRQDMTDGEARTVVELLNAIRGIQSEVVSRMLHAATIGWRAPVVD